MSCITTVCFQGAITNILEENVVQPLLVSTSAIHLATETVKSIMKIDDIVSTCKTTSYKQNKHSQKFAYMYF